MKLAEFKKNVPVSLDDICREFYRENRASMKIKKENVAVKNMVAIIDATLALSNQKGFNAMSLRDLSRQSGLSMGALYTYFSSKEDLLRIIHAQGQRYILRVLSKLVEAENGPAEKLRAFIRSHIYLSEIMGRWFSFFFMETRHLDPAMRVIPMESERATERLILDILEDGTKRGVFDVRDVALTGSLVKAMMQDWYLKRWKYREKKISVEEFADFVTAFVESRITPQQ